MTMQRIPEVPADLPVHHRRFFQAMRKILVENGVQGGPDQPGTPSNVVISPVGASIVVQFTKDPKADSTTLYVNSSGDLTSAQVIPLGVSAKFSDNVGTNVTRFYWLQSNKNGHPVGAIVGPYQATALTAGTAGTVATPPPPASPVHSVVPYTGRGVGHSTE